MDFNFLSGSIKKSAYSERPLSILNPAERDAFAFIMEILLLETGARQSWEHWQEQQLSALISHAKKRSKFWRSRAGSATPTMKDLKRLPILTRKEVTSQVSTEGSLLTKADKIGVNKRSTSGSSGTPVNFYVSAVNGRYNGVRAIAQDVLEQQDFRENRVKISTPSAEKIAGKKSYFEVSKTKGRLGPLENVFEHGATKRVYYLNDKDALLKELRKTPPHHLICAPAVMDILIEIGGIELLKELGIKRWIQFAGHRSPEIENIFKDANVSISANYSCEEIGPIGFECTKCPNHYHIAVSNVIVETDDSLTTEVNGETLSRVLITHLHSYATPFIRYDIGDFANLSHSCECGHDGPTLSKIYGRAKQFVFYPDGSYESFFFRAKEIQSRVECSEFQIHQKDIETIIIQIGGRESLTNIERCALIEFVRLKTGENFNVEILPVLEIDWSNNPKQLGFTSVFG